MKNNLQVRMQMVEGDPMLCLGVADSDSVFFLVPGKMAQRLFLQFNYDITVQWKMTMLETKLIFLGFFFISMILEEA